MTCVPLHISICHLQHKLTAYALLLLQIILWTCPVKPFCCATVTSWQYRGFENTPWCCADCELCDTPKNIDALFQEARATDAVLCFDEAEGLFGTCSSDMGNSTDRYAAMDVGESPSQHQNNTTQNKTKQNKTKQNKTKQNKTKQNKTKQNKTKQNKRKEEGKRKHHTFWH